jgi:hypothetical protein
MKVIYIFLIAVLFSCTNRDDKLTKEEINFNLEVKKCYRNPEDLIVDDSIVENCLNTLVKNYPTRIEGYLFLCEFLHEKKRNENLNDLQQIIQSKFNLNTKFLIQKNFFKVFDSTDFVISDFKILKNREETGELTESEIIDFEFMLNHLKLNQKQIKNPSKQKFIIDYFK